MSVLIATIDYQYRLNRTVQFYSAFLKIISFSSGALLPSKETSFTNSSRFCSLQSRSFALSLIPWLPWNVFWSRLNEPSFRNTFLFPNMFPFRRILRVSLAFLSNHVLSSTFKFNFLLQNRNASVSTLSTNHHLNILLDPCKQIFKESEENSTSVFKAER